MWELAARVGWLPPDVLAGPSTVLTAGWDLARDGTLTEALWTSLRRVAWGLGLGIPIGTLLALAAGLSRLGDDLVDANLQMLRFVPIIGLQPLLIVWLGVGETTKVSLIVLGVAFPIYVNTSSAIRAIDPGFIELADVVGLSRWAQVRRVVLPGSLPGFLVGLRLATGVAWLLLVFAEQINATSGIGYLMVRAQTFFQTDVIVVCLVTYAVLGLLSDGVVRALERRWLRWRPGPSGPPRAAIRDPAATEARPRGWPWPCGACAGRRAPRRAAGPRPRPAAGRVRGPARPQRVGQEHPAPGARRARPRGRGRGPGARAALRRVPGRPPAAVGLGARQRRARPPRPRPRRGAGRRSPRSASPATRTTGPRPCRAARPSGPRWPGRWSASRSCCCSTSPSAPSTR